MRELYKQLKQYGQVKLNEPLSKHTTFKIGGTADLLVIVEDNDRIAELLKMLDGSGARYFVLGGGSNILVSDQGIHGVVVKINNRQIAVKDDIVEAGAGCSLVEVARKSIQARLAGLEWGVGVPGSIGGSVRGNAGSMGSEIKDSLEWAVAYKDGEVIKMTNKECLFGYRDSIFKHKNIVIISVGLKLKKSEDKNAMKKVMENIKHRTDTQPSGYPSAGCVFKNVEIPSSVAASARASALKEKIPDEFMKNGIIPAGWLVEQVGMKGKKIRNAEVSVSHANFILNKGRATATDVLELIAAIKEKVYTKFGIELEEEIKII